MKRRTHLILFVLALFVGATVGLGIFTFVYAQGHSYLQDDPAVCANCHVMKGHFDSWAKGSHKDVATCNGCHTPHGFLAKYAVKAINGFNHSVKFTTGGYPDIMRANAMNKTVTENACRDCHGDLVHDIETPEIPDPPPTDELSCVRCHRFVGHDL